MQTAVMGDYKLPAFTIQIGLIQSLPKVQHPVSVIQFVAITLLTEQLSV
jgi:hypothetical protein